MKLELEFNDCWVESLDIQHIEKISQKDITGYFKRKRDFDCYAYQGKLQLDITIENIEYLVNNYYPVEINYNSIKIKN